MIKPLSKKYTLNVLNLIRNGMEKELLNTTIYSAKNIDVYLDYLIDSHGIAGYYYFGYFIENNLVGFSEWRDMDGKSLFLNNIFVDDNFKGKKIGSSLMSHGLSFANSINKKEVFLDVTSTNDTALVWYKKIGFYEQYTSYLYEIIDKLITPKRINSSIISNYAQAMGLYEKFGFTYLNLETKLNKYTIGVPNSSYYKIESPFDTEDDDLMRVLENLYPQHKAIFISDEIEGTFSALRIRKLASRIRMKKELNRK